MSVDEDAITDEYDFLEHDSSKSSYIRNKTHYDEYNFTWDITPQLEEIIASGDLEDTTPLTRDGYEVSDVYKASWDVSAATKYYNCNYYVRIPGIDADALFEWCALNKANRDTSTGTIYRIHSSSPPASNIYEETFYKNDNRIYDTRGSKRIANSGWQYVYEPPYAFVTTTVSTGSKPIATIPSRGVWVNISMSKTFDNDTGALKDCSFSGSCAKGDISMPVKRLDQKYLEDNVVTKTWINSLKDTYSQSDWLMEDTSDDAYILNKPQKKTSVVNFSIPIVARNTGKTANAYFTKLMRDEGYTSPYSWLDIAPNDNNIFNHMTLAGSFIVDNWDEFAEAMYQRYAKSTEPNFDLLAELSSGETVSFTSTDITKRQFNPNPYTSNSSRYDIAEVASVRKSHCAVAINIHQTNEQKYFLSTTCIVFAPGVTYDDGTKTDSNTISIFAAETNRGMPTPYNGFIDVIRIYNDGSAFTKSEYDWDTIYTCPEEEYSDNRPSIQDDTMVFTTYGISNTPMLNGSVLSEKTYNGSFYAPVTSGNKGDILVSGGANLPPVWSTATTNIFQSFLLGYGKYTSLNSDTNHMLAITSLYNNSNGMIAPATTGISVATPGYYLIQVSGSFIPYGASDTTLFNSWDMYMKWKGCEILSFKHTDVGGGVSGVLKYMRSNIRYSLWQSAIVSISQGEIDDSVPEQMYLTFSGQTKDGLSNVQIKEAEFKFKIMYLGRNQ